jgi:hypothetical protein
MANRFGGRAMELLIGLTTTAAVKNLSRGARTIKNWFWSNRESLKWLFQTVMPAACIFKEFAPQWTQRAFQQGSDPAWICQMANTFFLKSGIKPAALQEWFYAKSQSRI